MSRMANCVSLLSMTLFGIFALVTVSYGQASNTWLSAGQLSQPRTAAAAVLLQDGRILITGGLDSNGVPQASTEIFDPATGQFSAAASMNVARANHAAIVLNTGDVLVTGGVTDAGGDYTDSAEIFSAGTQQWAQLQATLPQALTGHAMALLADGNVLIAGGQSTTGPISTLLLFNAADNSITSVGTLITARTNAAAAGTPDGRVLIAGGTDINNNVLASSEIFTYAPTTLSGTVSAGPTLTYPRTAATATSTYDGVALIGGYNLQNGTQIDLGTAEIFSQWTNAFRLVSGATPRSGHFAVRLPNNGAILAMGGTGTQTVDLLEPWANGTAGAFVAASTSLSNQTGGFAAPATLGSILAAGGQGSAAATAELYWFPTIATDQPDYAPDTPVLMTGTGFQPGESVDLHLHEWVNQTVTDLPDYTVITGSNGTFSFTGYAPTTTDLGARYHLTAIGETSALQAQTIFTDSIHVQAATTTIEESSCHTATSTFTQGQTVCASVNVSNLNGNNGAAAFSIVWFDPSSATNPVKTTSETVGLGTFTDTLPTSVSSTTGTWTVKVCNALPCSSGQNTVTSATASFTLNSARVSTATTVSSPTVTYGASATSTVTITANSGSTAPTGSITMAVNNGGSASCGPLSGSATTSNAICTITYGGVGSYTLTPTYTPSGNFTVGTVSGGTLTINAAPLTVNVTASNKQYDTTTSATLNCTVNGGLISPDTSICSATGAFIDPNAGTGKTVNISSVTLSNSNYNIPSPPTTATANITPAPLTVSVAATNKQYDTTVSATLNCTVTSGLLGSDSATCSASGSFADANAGNNKTVNISSVTASNSNYSIPSPPASTAANITPTPLTVNLNGTNKQYDTTPAATISCTVTSGLLGSDNATCSASGTFADANAGNNKTVNISSVSASNSNYSIPSPPTTATANITPAPLTVSVAATNKQYDTTVSATLSCTVTGGLLGSDNATCSASGTFADANAGNNKTVDISSVTVSNSNYDIPSPPTSTTANITPAPLTVSATSSNKQYDTTSSATLTCIVTKGLLGLDSSTCSAIGAFIDANAGNNKIVNINSVSAGNSNYNIPSPPASTTANITPAPLTATITAGAKQYDGNTTATLSCSLPSGVFSGDAVTCTATGAFASKDVASPQTVNITNIALEGAQAGNYSLTATAGTTSANITPAPVTVSVTAKQKQYDATTSATLNCTVAGGLISPDTSNCSATGAFVDAIAGVGKTVSIRSVIVANSNYNIPSPPSTTTATITPAPLTITAKNETKTYGQTFTPDGSTQFIENGLLGSDGVTSVTLTSTGYAASATVPGSPYAIVPSAAMGTGLGNYTIAYTSGWLTVNKAFTTAVVTSTANPSVLNQAVTFTATVSVTAPGSGTPTGTVTFTIDGVAQLPSPLSGVSATFTTSSLAISATGHNVSAMYNGDLNFESSNNAALAGGQMVKYAAGGVCDGDAGHQMLQPIDTGGLSVFKSSSTTPAKFRVCDAKGISMGMPGVIQAFQVIGVQTGTTGTPDLDVPSTTPDSMFRWDPTGQQWIFNVSNKNLGPANQTYMFLITLNDGSKIPFQYGLR